MKLCRCPVCHSNIHLDTLVQDDAAREMLAILAPMDGGLARILVAYIGLFRPEKSDLSWNRALKLINETLAVSNNRDWLRAALEETVKKLRESRIGGTFRPVTNHNYLKKVLEGLTEGSMQPAQPVGPQHTKPAIEVKSFERPVSAAELNRQHFEFVARFQNKGTTSGKDE
ncbi:hypothetical protein JYB87_12665 [Shewanella avicenniae]|uniref:Uncharacterized protein n=1 Tax=Shewanella avicenniae TaxID=2814294 RepID=A0ABX7QMI6_9GAMM|nr:hypothetical protein [Shewanella avicenniae]QSX32604.1 hypothetical protein JYB87_12665 [Shewanella avicenniae]